MSVNVENKPISPPKPPENREIYSDGSQKNDLKIKHIPRVKFISMDGKSAELYIDGKRVDGLTKIVIEASMNKPVTYLIEGSVYGIKIGAE